VTPQVCASERNPPLGVDVAGSNEDLNGRTNKETFRRDVSGVVGPVIGDAM